MKRLILRGALLACLILGVSASSAAAACTVTDSSLTNINTQLATPGAIVCLTAGSYGHETITASPASNSQLTAAGGAHVTIAGVEIDGSHISVLQMHSTAGITINGGSHDTVSSNDVTNTACGYGISVFGVFSGGTWSTVATGDYIGHNKVHDTGTTCESDAIRIQGYQNLEVIGNDIYNITDPTGAHSDTLQSYQAGIATSGLTIARNYVHDTCVDQGFPFLKDGDITNVGINDNLVVRGGVGACSNPSVGTDIVENSDPVTIRNNVNLTGASIQNAGTAASPTALIDHDVLYSLNTLGPCGSSTCSPGYALTENHNMLTGPAGATWSLTPDPSDVFNSAPAFKCGSSCGDGTLAGDDYELAANPDGIGIDWAPAAQVYGPTH